MHILQVSHYALPHIGGIEVVVDALAREMIARGHSVTHIASATGDSTNASQPYSVIRLPASDVVAKTLHLPYPLPYRGAAAVLEAEIAKADVVHVHGMLYYASHTALRIARRRGHRCRILTEHVGSIAYRSAIVRFTQSAAIATIGRQTARRAQAIITLNARVSEEMRTLAPRTTIAQIDNGVDLHRYHPATPAEREQLRRSLGWDTTPRVLFVGRLVEKKGVGLAIEAARLADGAFELVLVGPGRIDGLPPHVQHHGEASPERVAELYRAADAFLLPSHGEGFPLTAQEAMASGLPIILRDDPTYHEILAGSGEAAQLAAPDPVSVRDAVLRALRNAPAAATDAAAFARRRFDWSQTADRHLELYERVRS